MVFSMTVAASPRASLVSRSVSIALSVAVLLGPCSKAAWADDAEDVLPEATTKAAPADQGKAGPITAPAGADENLTIDDVKIEGNRLVPSEDILGVVKTKKGDRFDRDQVMQDLKAINGLGYFDDRSLQVVPERTNGGVLLKIRVQENAPVTQFAFQGNQVMSSEDIQKSFSDQLGKPQNLTQLSTAIDKVEGAYHDKGYVLARVTDVKDDPDGSIQLTINEGTIDSVQFVGNKKTKDFVIKHYIKTQPGQVYNERQLTSDLRKLYNQGYFSDIRRSLSPSPTNPDKYTLKVEVDEKRTGSVGVGGGVDSIAGPFGSLSFSDSNFHGKGQVLSFTSQIGSGMFGQINNTLNNGGTGFLPNQKTYQVEASFIEPNLKGSDVSMAVTGFARSFGSLLIDDSQQRTIGASLNFTKPLAEHLNLNLGFTGESTALTDLSSLIKNANILENMEKRALATGAATTQAGAAQLASTVRKNQLAGGIYASINPSISYDTRDAAIDPTKGTLARLTASPSLGLTGSSFMKAGASVSKFVPINDRAGLAFNMQGGTSVGGMPQFAQYRLGGWNGMRGYRAFSDLGSGSSMLMATAEVRSHLPFLKNTDSKVLKAIDKHVKGVAFFDVGQVSGNSLTNSLFSRGQMGASVGLGLRLNLPMIGLIRLDYGLPLVSTLLGKTTPRFTVGFGERF
jgi:outer membrane protein insertion porin family